TGNYIGLNARTKRWKPMSHFDLKSIFSSLESSAATLNDASDAANKTLIDAESFLVGLNIGLESWYPTALETTDPIGGAGLRETSHHFADFLGFSRSEGKWCFVIKRMKFVSGFYHGDEECPYTNEYLETPPAPLLKHSRGLRIKALGVLPEFLSQISKQVQTKALEVSKASYLLKD